MEGADFPPISGSHIGTTFPRVVLAVPRIIYLPFPLPSGGGGARRGGTGAEGEGGNACPIQDKPPPWDADPRFCREFGPEDYGDEDIVAFLRRLMARDPHGRHRIRMNSNSGRLQLWHYDPSLDDFYEEEEKKEGKGEGEGARGRNKMQSTLCGFRKSLLCQSSRTWSSPSPPPRPWSSPSPPRSAFSRGRPPSPLGPSLLQLEMPQKLLVTEEEADRLAEELVAEEERAKRRAEKKRLKKKRQKERKRQERMEQESGGGKVSDQVMEGAAASAVAGPAAAGASNLTSSPQSPSQGSSNEEEELDLSSTFVSQARRKIGDRSPNSQREKGSSPEPPAWNRQSQSPQEGSRSQSPQPEALPGLQAAALRQSQELAELGTAAAWRGMYQEAVLLFTKAIKLNPRDYRLFGNRSFCHERLGQPGWALGDARVALNLRPQWPQGLFQLGRALVGLQRFKEAADVFRETLAMDKSQPDVVHELQQCLLQLTLQEHQGGIHGAALKPRTPQQFPHSEAGAQGLLPLNHFTSVSPRTQGLLPPPWLPSALWPITQAQSGSFWSAQLQDFSKGRGILGQPPRLSLSRCTVSGIPLIHPAQ
ncbi:tetratricopeptide repeat protein 31 isoform X3 [Phascolarctos cinereus]|uniref:Tetratricopeptide repeat protein 31 isoform X3 n=1 Tax=Phascolarctos cinereus TaxID=38626 RepID=A0A6P5LR53_PHACI|nr:tetratricopeptide repeat protein 31 isoform X3 [Phascolarctos cinereus]